MTTVPGSVPGSVPAPTAVAIVVPVHDEEATLGRCLHAVEAAVERARETNPSLLVETVVVLDACSDGSQQVAERFAVRVVRIAARRVGDARRAGVDEALARLDARGGSADAWICTTDADSEVPENWLEHQLLLSRRGADVVLGTVRPDFARLSGRHVAHWLDTHPRGRPAGNVHGANLGLRADVYRATGGFDDVDEHEDVRLVAAARAVGARVIASDEHEVLTSARFVGRTPGGYASFLHEMHRRLSTP